MMGSGSMEYHALSTLNLINSESPTDHQLLMGMRFLSLSLYMLKRAYIRETIHCISVLAEKSECSLSTLCWLTLV